MFHVAWLAFFAVMLPAFGNGAHADETSRPLVKTKMKIAFLQSFFADVNRLDAEAAMKVFARTMGEFYGYDADIAVQSFQNAKDILTAPDAGNIEILLLDSWSYLEVEQAKWIEPVFVSSEQEQVVNRYYLLTNGNNKINNLSELRGKRLNLLTAANAMIGLPWLKILLIERGLGTPDEFFNQVTQQSDPMRTILQVFFGKADAALVDEMRFQLMMELNPQLKRLKIIETSEPFPNIIFCIKRSGWSPPRMKKDIINTGNELHLEPKARQVFTLFKFGRLTPFEPSHLDTVRRLRQKAIAAETQRAAAPGRPDGN